MDKLTALYYERFLQHVVESYSPTLKGAKAGHCMKITGLPVEQLEILYTMLLGINSDIDISILSDEKTGSQYISATKLIEKRNDPTKTILILVPSNSRTSAEDSYGDATFQNLSAIELLRSFFYRLVDEIPEDKKSLTTPMIELLNEIGVSVSDLISYILYLDIHGYSKESLGNGLYLFGLLPDKGLLDDESKIRRRFYINLEKVSVPLADFSATPVDRVVALPLQKQTIQADLVAMLNENDDIVDRHSLFKKIHDNYPQYNYDSMPWLKSGQDTAVKISAEIVPGKDPKKELVKEDNGSLILSIPVEKKGKVSFTIHTDPSPKDNPDIVSFEIALVETDEYNEIAVLKKAKVGTNKRAQRKLSVNIANGLVDDGDYLLRVRALDANGIVLDMKKEFKEERVQEAWLAAKAENPDLSMEQFRQDNNVAYTNETAIFTIDNSGEDVVTDGSVDKRTKISTFTQAVIQYRAFHLAKGEDLDIEDTGADRNAWIEGNLNNTYQFDFGPSFAYQIQLPKKLIQLERVFLNNGDKYGHVEALITGNPTDMLLLDPNDTARRSPRFVDIKNVNIPDELVTLRETLFDLIKDSADNSSGLSATFDIKSNLKAVRDYLSAHEQWLREITESELDEKTLVAIQNLDTVKLHVEMPDGTFVTVKLLTPLHPLRLAWMVNLLGLYNDWEEKTIENPKYKKFWSRKLDKLFLGGLPLDIAPLVLSENSLKEAYQYAGEITFGWGMFAQPRQIDDNGFASGARQLKSYLSTLLNVAREKRIDADVSKDLVTRHLYNFGLSHPYTDKLVINLFNAGDASVFAQSLVDLERIGLGYDLTYEIRLFADDNMLQSGDAFKDLLDPESNIAAEVEVFSQASANRLFPKLRFSLNKLSDFINNHDKYQAHISFLINPFAVVTDLARPSELKRSFYLNGTICRNVIDASREGKSFVWKRYFSNKSLPNPSDEWANTEVGIFARIQEVSGKLLSSTVAESVPATTLRLKESDMMLLSFVHDCSDWVVTFDKNMGPEFYDLPCMGEDDVPYLLDYIPKEETIGISSFLTTKPTSEIASLMIPVFKEYGIDIENKRNFREILEDVRSVSSSLLMQVNSTSRKGFEVIGTILTKRFLEKKHIMRESFMIPVDLHKELFEDLDTDNKERADNLVVKIDPDKREILFNVVEIKCRNAHYQHDELHEKMLAQIKNTIEALRTRFEISVDGQDRLDRELKTLEFRSFLQFYINRATQYNQLNKELADKYLLFLSKLSDGYSLRFKQLGVIFDFNQPERQKKDFLGDAVIYTMGQPVINMILDDNSTLNTQKLEDLDNDFICQFEPSFNYELKPSSDELVIHPVNPVVKTKHQEEHVEEIVIPKTKVSSDKPEDVNVDKAPLEKKTSTESSPADAVEIDVADTTPSATNEENKKTSEELTLSGGATAHNQAVDCDYHKPSYDVIIGKNSDSPQYGILGKMSSNGRVIGMDLNECHTISLFGVQGAGKSYTIGSVTEMVLKQFSNVNHLPAPMASVIFHYSDSMYYAPEFTSMVYPNDEAEQLAKLKAEYGADAGRIEDVILLTPERQLEERKSEYPDLAIHPIAFDSAELSIKDWMFLMGAIGNDSIYIKELKEIMRDLDPDISLSGIKEAVSDSEYLSSSQKRSANHRLKFASRFLKDGFKLRNLMKPGRLIIVDLRDQLIEKEEALGLFVVMLNIFSGVKAVNGVSFNKFIVFDEAHKYMNNKDLVSSITEAIREMRHRGVSVMIASQDPMSLPTDIIELSSIVVMHRFSSPAWVKHVQKAITPLQNLTPTEMAALGSGEAYIWANKASDKAITQRPIKISIRPRVTKHGGDTIQAVK